MVTTMHLLRVASGYSRWPYKEVESCDNVGGAKDAPNPTSDKTIPPLARHNVRLAFFFKINGIDSSTSQK